MRPKTPLVDRIAQGTDVSVEMIQDTIHKPVVGDGPCWEWNRSANPSGEPQAVSEDIRDVIDAVYSAFNLRTQQL